MVVSLLHFWSMSVPEAESWATTSVVYSGIPQDTEYAQLKIKDINQLWCRNLWHIKTYWTKAPPSTCQEHWKVVMHPRAVWRNQERTQSINCRWYRSNQKEFSQDPLMIDTVMRRAHWLSTDIVRIVWNRLISSPLWEWAATWSEACLVVE